MQKIVDAVILRRYSSASLNARWHWRQCAGKHSSQPDFKDQDMLKTLNHMHRTQGPAAGSCACMRACLDRLSNWSPISIRASLPCFGYEQDQKYTGEPPM